MMPKEKHILVLVYEATTYIIPFALIVGVELLCKRRYDMPSCSVLQGLNVVGQFTTKDLCFLPINFVEHLAFSTFSSVHAIVWVGIE